MFKVCYKLTKATKKSITDSNVYQITSYKVLEQNTREKSKVKRLKGTLSSARVITQEVLNKRYNK